MFYESGHRDHALLPHDPLKAIVAPRPIGWISTLSPDGVANLAPYSFFNLVSERPPIVMFISTSWKDTVRNIAETGEFVCNLATRDLMDAVNASSAPLPPEVSEFEHAGVEAVPSRLIKAPRVAQAPCALECVRIETRELTDRDGKPTGAFMTLGQVLGVHIDDSFVEGGLLRIEKLHSLARCGYFDYSSVETVTSRPRPR